ncbi:MAG: hypothetical protein ACRDL5_16200 [Solirubrobacteraceae bacterium]
MATFEHPPEPDAQAGWRVARAACAHAGTVFGDRLVSVYAIGSLAHGGFASAVSDVDVAVFVDRCDERLPAAIATVVQSTRTQLDPGLADRLSIFYGDWPSFAAPPQSARLYPIDRLDVMEHGLLMLGADLRAQHGVRPTRAELEAQTASLLAALLAQRRSTDELIAGGTRVLTRAVLLPIRCLYTQATGRAGANHDAVRWYRDHRGQHLALAEAALSWRSGAIDTRAARLLLERQLEGLYDESRRALGI